MYKNYAANIKLMPRETKIVTFPNGYFKIIPTITVISQKNIVPSVGIITKKYFKLTNPTNMPVVFSYNAIATRQQKKVFADLDGDGIPDNIDTDIDGDDVLNNDDAFPYDDTETTDTDNDGIGNNTDLDDDNDGLSDEQEILLGTNPLNQDSDNDGLFDSFEANFISDPTNPDSDGDGINDGDEFSAGTLGVGFDSDGDGIDDYDEYYIHNTQHNNPDSDDDGYFDGQEIAAGSDPLSADSIPQPAAAELKSIYISLETINSTSSDDETITIYSGEMFDLIYPNIVDLQPDSNGNTNYEIISYDASSFNNLSLETQRIKSINTNTYENTGDDALFRIDNVVTGQEYNIFTKARTLSGNNNQPQINIALKSSNSSEEESSTFFGELNAESYTNIMPLDNVVDLNLPKYWIHSFVVDSNDNISLTTSNPLDAPFTDSTFAFLNIHSKYTQNSDLTNPDIEIAIQDASFDQNNDGIDNYAGYIFAGSYELESLSPNLYSTIQNGNYGAIETLGSSDSNTNNHSRINVMLDARVRYRMHVKVGQGTDCDFSINFNPQDMFNYIDIDTYNQDFNSDSDVVYHNLIPNDHDSSVSQTYYYYFIIREDGFIIWE